MTYRVIAVDQEPWNKSNRGAHIVQIGTRNDEDATTRRWSVEEAIAAIENGEEFYTRAPNGTGKRKVVIHKCSKCHHRTIQSSPSRPGATDADNLNSLPRL